MAGLLDALSLGFQTALAAETLKLNQQMAEDAYQGAVQSAALKRSAILEGLWSFVEKSATATAKRASAAADIWNQF
ncbi:MAG: hypothetical protein GZ090_03520 [Oxalobacteraceae bacterium]|jgi:hypothetical protein|nr:hypothetical protein [Oxalobacteraceae bacterium]